MAEGQRIEAAGVVIMEAGYKRSPIDIARDFVREQSAGEWGDEVEEKDAQKIAELLIGYANSYSGPVIPPFEFGGERCMCKPGTEGWCQAIGCPRRVEARS